MVFFSIAQLTGKCYDRLQRRHCSPEIFPAVGLSLIRYTFEKAEKTCLSARQVGLEDYRLCCAYNNCYIYMITAFCYFHTLTIFDKHRIMYL